MLPSPTRSEGGAPEELRQALELAQTAASKNPRSSGLGLEAVSMPVLVVARTTDKVVFISYVDDPFKMESLINKSINQTNQPIQNRNGHTLHYRLPPI